MRRRIWFAALMAMLWLPIAYALLAGLLFLARLVLEPTEALLVVVPATLVLATLSVVAIGRALRRDLLRGRG